jgi:hypothetical protein
MTLSPTPLTPGVGATFKQQVDTANGGSITGMPLVQIAPYPMIGGISSDGNNLCTGYEAGCFYNLPNAKLIPIDTGIQMCNPSIDPDPDTTNRMMFLNFGGSVPQNLINPFEDDPTYPANSQGVLPMHSVLFVVDTTNTVKNFIPISLMGSGYSAWQCPQWSNKPDFAAALAASNDESASWDLVLLKNISSRGNEQKLIVTLGSGKMNTESTPFLWIGN